MKAYLLLLVIPALLLTSCGGDNDLKFEIRGSSYPTCTVAGDWGLGVSATIKDAEGKVVGVDEYAEPLDGCAFLVEVTVPKSDFYTVEVNGQDLGTYPASRLKGGSIRG